MVDVVGVTFKDNGKVYYFSSNNLELKKNVTVIVETERGLQFAKVVEETKKMDEKQLKRSLNKVIRIASKKDYYQHRNNLKDSEEALNECRNLIKKNDLNMNVLEAYYNFDRTQLIFKFVSDNRVDFRNLAKQLASIYKTRIELRQIGVRDKAKEIGGLGICGRCLCCTKFLNDLDSVSINMAKNQNLALNPTKINGACGRLLCCLKYEDECYTSCKKGLPDVGDVVETNGNKGKIISVDILQRKCKVELENGSIEDIVYEKECCGK